MHVKETTISHYINTITPYNSPVLKLHWHSIPYSYTPLDVALQKQQKQNATYETIKQLRQSFLSTEIISISLRRGAREILC